MHADSISIEANKIIETDSKGRILAEVLTDKLEPWSADKCSEKNASVQNSGQRISRFKIYKYYIIITMCQLTGSSYLEPM